MSTSLKIQRVKALKQNEQCWGCGTTLPKGSEATLHLERGEGKGTQIAKSYWCDCCIAFCEKYPIYAKNGLDEHELKDNEFYKRFRMEWENENKKGE